MRMSIEEAERYLRTHDSWFLLHTTIITKRQWVIKIDRVGRNYKRRTVFNVIDGKWKHCNVVNTTYTEDDMMSLMTHIDSTSHTEPINIEQFIEEHFVELL